MTPTREGGGRLRLGWRLLAFLGVATAVTGIAAALLPRGIWWGAGATLAGALAGGWTALALEGRGPGALGFHLAPSVPREVGQGFALGAALAMAVVALLLAAGGVRWGTEAGAAGAWVTGAMRTLALLAVAAAAEEAFLRGYLLRALAEGWGAGGALVATSLAFGALHLGNPGATLLGGAGTAAAGLFLGAVVLRTGSLWWGTGAHLGWNWGVAYLADLPVSGMEVADAPWVAPAPAGPAWLGGGAFGPEASVVAVAGFLGAAAWCWWGGRLRPEPAAEAHWKRATGSEDRRDPASAGAEAI